LGGCEFDEVTVGKLFSSVHLMKNIKVLDLSKSIVVDPAINALVKNYKNYVCLEHANLSQTRIAGMHFETMFFPLMWLFTHGKLRYLDLSGNRMANQEAKIIVKTIKKLNTYHKYTRHMVLNNNNWIDKELTMLKATFEQYEIKYSFTLLVNLESDDPHSSFEKQL